MRKYYEFFVEGLIFVSGIASIVFVLLIFIFLLKEGLMLFKSISVSDFLLGKDWYPISEPPRLGILPLILGSLWVTVGATAISVPLGIGCAIYIGEIAPIWLKEILKAGVIMVAGCFGYTLGGYLTKKDAWA